MAGFCSVSRPENFITAVLCFLFTLGLRLFAGRCNVVNDGYGNWYRLANWSDVCTSMTTGTSFQPRLHVPSCSTTLRGRAVKVIHVPKFASK